MESWSIAEVARMSGVTSRALRHYDAIGLLPPARVAADGRRHYGRRELLRLQRILLLRELGVGLPAIREAIAHTGNETAVLRRHRDRLEDERDRLARLVRTVEATVEGLEGGEEMTAEGMFEGFEHNPYEAEARERYGDEAVDGSWRKLRALRGEDAELARTGFRRVHSGLAPLRDAGVPVDDPRVQELVALHHRVVSLFWEPSPEAYRNLGPMYVEDERFQRTIGGPELTAYLRDAMGVYADSLR
ncbi:MAG TPA: MerR family transcriptional regulator [Mycobacteriales bacterium]|nr:MerR family transcriptional regulator [Mycobacteriales bacterium]